MSWHELSSRGLAVRPWDGAKPACEYRHSPFSATLSKTLALLAREVRMLDGQNIVILLDVRERDIRLDGYPRADARVGEPCVAVSFESKHGPVRMVTGEYRKWEENLRAVALSLEALRAVDRYGVAKTGEQYRGWRAIPATTDAASAIVTREQAVEVLYELTGHLYERSDIDGPWLEDAIRASLFKTHPDRGGDPDSFRKVVRAREILRGRELSRA